MAFVYGTISNASPGATLYTDIADGLTTEGFTLVDTVVISTRTHKIWKCAAANNSHNLDWYLDVVYSTTGAGSIWFAPFEDFDPATDLGYRGIYVATSGTIDPATFSRYGSTGYALETNWNTTSAGLALTTSTTSFGYWLSITPDRIVGLSSVSAGELIYSGFYSPHPMHIEAVGEPAIYPLVNTRIRNNNEPASGTSPVEAAFTRVPGLVTVGSYGFYYYLVVKASTLTYFLSMPPLPSGATNSFSVRGATPVLLMTAADSALGFNALWGTLHDVAAIRTPSTVVRGDTTTVAGSPWILTSSSGSGSTMGCSLLFKA